MFYLILKCQKSFKFLKKHFITTSIPVYFDFKKEYILETDLSDNVSAEVFSQYIEVELLHLVAFFSCKYLPQEINYEIYDKELFAIIKSFEE